MGKIVISENISLDGVIEDPTGEGGLPNGGWFNRIADHDRAEWAKIEYAEALDADALLLGRRTYEYFAERWTARPGEWADRLRSLPKYVVSSTPLDGPQWTNSSVLAGEVPAAVARLKQDLAGDIVVYGSGQLARTLIEQQLVDEVRLMVYPAVVGPGARLFGESTGLTSLRLLGTQSVGDALALLTYAVVH